MFESGFAVNSSMEVAEREARIEDSNPDPLKDPVVRFLHFKAHTNPLHYAAIH